MSEGEKKYTLQGDAAKKTITDDKFDLSEIAHSIAALLMNRVSADGYTIGISGEWGSGKTTLVNFVVEDIEKKKSLTHKIMRFDPWLVGKRDILIHEFFNGLLAKIVEFRSNSVLEEKIKNEDPGRLEALIAKIEKYRELLDGAAKVVATAAPFDPSQHAGVAAFFLKVLGQAAAMVTKFFKPKPKTLEGLREAIKEDLNALEKLSPGTRFIIVIDEMDRLDPEESVEILRLIRAVADFPLVTYIVCFDRGYLAKQVQRVIGVGDGHEYLEKIFQNILTLPPQEPFALRRLAAAMLQERFPDEFNYSDSPDRGAERAAIFFDRWAGKFLTTPRQCVRFVEAVTFGWPYLEGEADFIDYAWLQLIRLQRHDLYKWVRDYVVNVGSLRDGGRPGDQEAVGEAVKLVDILEAAGWTSERDYSGISYFLPGMKHFTDTGKRRVLEPDEGELSSFELGQRLGSPSHWRMYFAFDLPSYALSDDDIHRFRDAASASNIEEGSEIIRTLLRRPHAQAGHFLATFLERLHDTRDNLTAEEQAGILKIFGDVMDEVKPESEGFFSFIGPWRRAELILGPPAGPALRAVVEHGKALNWISDALRSQGFAFGRPERSRERPDEQWLDEQGFDECLSICLRRIRLLGIEGILKAPQPVTMLFLWHQLGDTEKLKELIDAFVIPDDAFVRFLDGLRGWADSSARGRYRSLQTTSVQPFLHPEIVDTRLKWIIANDAAPKSLIELAKDIESSWDFR